MKKMEFELWEYINENFYIKWKNILKPPQFIFKLNKNNFELIISDEKNNPENNYLKIKQKLNLRNKSSQEIEIIDKYNKILKMKKENLLEKNKCNLCPFKTQRKDLLKNIKIENLNYYEQQIILDEIKMTIRHLNDRYEKEEHKIKVTCN